MSSSASSSSGIYRVMIAGAGTMGQEFAVYCHFHGFEVRLFDTNPDALRNAVENKKAIGEMRNQSQEWDNVRSRILRELTITREFSVAANGADLVIECIPERLNLKQNFFREVSQLCPAPTILVTNTSTLLPSQMAASVAQPERFSAFHLLNESSAVEIMGHSQTSTETLTRLQLFARQIALRPIVIRKENSGYLFTDMMTKLHYAALCLAANGVGDVADIDRVWMMVWQTRFGPFSVIDGMGLDTVLQITQLQAALTSDPQMQRICEFLSEYVDRGWLGVKAQKGFYSYPNPEYLQPEFVQVQSLPGPQRSKDTYAHSAPPALRDSQTELNHGDERIAQAGLFTFHLQAAPNVQPMTSEWSRPTRSALILGQNADALALQAELKRLQVNVTLLPTNVSIERTLEILEAATAEAPIPTLFLLTARDPDAADALNSPEDWQRRRDVGIERPYLVCQRWIQILARTPLQSESAVIAVTSLGGDFGFQNRCPAVESGALSGLLKGLDVESRGRILIKIVETESTAPSQSVVNVLLQELTLGRTETEVAYHRGQRWVIRADRYQPMLQPYRRIRPGTAWVVTGGARGITAVAAFELARRHQLKMFLLGSTEYQPVPEEWTRLPKGQLKCEVQAEAARAGTDSKWLANTLTFSVEIQQTLAAYEQAGLQAEYLKCDITDREQMSNALARIRTHGPITGLIHGAGLSFPAPIEAQTFDRLRMGLSVKLDGLVNLCWLTKHDPVEFLIGFGSTSGRFGAFLNADYSLANEMMCKMVSEYRQWRPSATTLSFHWTAWGDTGMCMKPVAHMALQAMKVRLMPACEGARHFCEVLESVSHHHEFLVTDHPGGVHSQHPSMSNPQV